MVAGRAHAAPLQKQPPRRAPRCGVHGLSPSTQRKCAARTSLLIFGIAVRVRSGRRPLQFAEVQLLKLLLEDLA